jgi:hypothetical protein
VQRARAPWVVGDARTDDAVPHDSTRVEHCSTTTGRDVRRRGIAFGPAARDVGAREANLRPPRERGAREGGDAMRDAQADVPSA